MRETRMAELAGSYFTCLVALEQLGLLRATPPLTSHDKAVRTLFETLVTAFAG